MYTVIDRLHTFVYTIRTMHPASWRKKEKLTLREVARRLGVSAASVQNYENSRRDAPTSVALAYERISGGEVTAEDLNRARRKYLREQNPQAA